MKTAVIGLGKAGLPLAAVIAEAGIQVIGIDLDVKRVEKINSGENPIPEEPELPEILKEYGGKELRASTDYQDASTCDAFIVIVPLFIDEKHEADFSILEQAFTSVAKVMKPGSLIVLETTVPPGTTKTKVKEWLDSSGKEYFLAYSPERIMTGFSVSRYRDFPKVVGGITEESGRKAYDLYKQFCREVNLVSNATTAELIKVSEGVYRDVNIALANELYKVARKHKVDFFEMKMFANHDYCHIHNPGNVGGHCIPVYPWFLINNSNVPLIEKARKLNDEMIHYYAGLLGGITSNGKVLVVGLTFREGVKELAYTRSIPMIRLLEQKGYSVFVYDPLFTRDEIEELGFKYEDQFNLMDGIVLMNYYPNLGLPKEKTIDIKGVFNDYRD